MEHAGLGEPGAPETAFGLVFPQPCPSTVHLPFHTTNFQMDLGSGFSHLEPVLGPHSSPNTWHTYLYIVKGQGKPLGFEQIDSNTADNYGQYKMLVIGFTTSQCSGIGWMMFNGMFSSSRDCSHYASPNGTSASQMSTPDYDAPTDFDSLSGTGGV